MKEYHTTDEGYGLETPKIKPNEQQYDLDLQNTVTKPTTEVVPPITKPEELSKEYQEMHDYFFKKLFLDSNPSELDFENIGEYYKNIQIKDTIHLGDNGNFKKSGINGYLLRAIINGKQYFLYTESLDEKSKVKHINTEEITLLISINNIVKGAMYDIPLEKLKEVINNKFLHILGKEKIKALKERLNKK